MNHYLADWIAQKENIAMNVEERNRLVDRFDVKGLVWPVDSVGADYYILAIGQNSGKYLSPNRTMSLCN